MHHFKVFFLAYFIAEPPAGDNSGDTAGIKINKKYFLPGGKIENCNVLIDERNFYGQPINDIIKQYYEARKI